MIYLVMELGSCAAVSFTRVSRCFVLCKDLRSAWHLISTSKLRIWYYFLPYILRTVHKLLIHLAVNLQSFRRMRAYTETDVWMTQSSPCTFAIRSASQKPTSGDSWSFKVFLLPFCNVLCLFLERGKKIIMSWSAFWFWYGLIRCNVFSIGRQNIKK